MNVRCVAPGGDQHKTDLTGGRSPVFMDFLWPFSVVVLWGLVFGVSVYFSRMGMHERDDETARQVEEEAKAESEAGWTPLLS